MQKKLFMLAGTIGALIFTGSPVSADLLSERGKVALNAPSTEIKRLKPKTTFARPERSWASAPPTIPHKSRGYKVTMKYNICMSCHVSNYKRMQAPKTPVSHYITYNGALNHDRLDSRRYFCTQCHVPQADTGTLVKNSYTNVALKAKNADPQHAALVAKGEKLVMKAECGECHQPGKTVDGIRYLEGWESRALVHVLKAYKNGDIQDNDMSDVVEDMEEEQMKAIGAYFASLSVLDKK